jgi:hypothetical protein
MCYTSRKQKVGNANKVFGGKFEGKGPTGRLMIRWEDNIKTDHKELW